MFERAIIAAIGVAFGLAISASERDQWLRAFAARCERIIDSLAVYPWEPQPPTVQEPPQPPRQRQI